jgi:hypothetical protein
LNPRHDRETDPSARNASLCRHKNRQGSLYCGHCGQCGHCWGLFYVGNAFVFSLFSRARFPIIARIARNGIYIFLSLIEYKTLQWMRLTSKKTSYHFNPKCGQCFSDLMTRWRFAPLHRGTMRPAVAGHHLADSHPAAVHRGTMRPAVAGHHLADSHPAAVHRGTAWQCGQTMPMIPRNARPPDHGTASPTGFRYRLGAADPMKTTMAPRRKKTDQGTGLPSGASVPLRPYVAGALRLDLPPITEADKKAGKTAYIRVSLTRDELVRLTLWGLMHNLEPGSAARHLIVRGLPRRLMVATDEELPEEPASEGPPTRTPAYTPEELATVRSALGLPVTPAVAPPPSDAA